MTRYISACYGAGNPPREDAVRSGVVDLVSYLNAYGHDFDDRDYGGLSIDAGDYNDSASQEADFIRDCVDEIDSGGLNVSSGENILIAHDKWLWGYGRSIYVSDHDCHGSTVYAGNVIPEWEVEGFTWHEAAHAYGADHPDGDYQLDNGFMYNISPMCMSYLRNASGEADTTYGSGGYVSYFDCAGEYNYEHSFKYSNKEANHNLNYLSTCTRSYI